MGVRSKQRNKQKGILAYRTKFKKHGRVHSENLLLARPLRPADTGRAHFSGRVGSATSSLPPSRFVLTV